MEKKIKKIFIGFFILMFILTIISRAAASVMIARVSVGTVKRGNLTYELSGNGEIKGNAKKYVDVKEGYKIGAVKVKKGEKVHKGDILFQYDMNSLSKKKTSLEAEHKKLELQYDKSALLTDSEDGSSQVDTAILTVKNAKEKLKEAKDNIKDIKETVGENKNKEYEAAVEDLENQKDSKEEELVKARRTVSDADNVLISLNKPNTTFEEEVGNYKTAVISKKEELINSVYNSLFDLYYNDKYEEHKQKVEEAKKKLTRAKDDLADIKDKWATAINVLDQYDPDLAKSYKEQVQQSKEDIKSAERTVSDAQEAFDQLVKPDEELDKRIQTFRSEIEKNNIQDSTYYSLYQIFEPKLGIDKDKIKQANENLTRAKEDEKSISDSWDKKINKAEKKKDNLLQDISKITDGTYNYSKDLKETNKLIEEATQSLTTAKQELENAIKAKDLNEKNKETQVQSANLDMEGLKIDMESKKEEIDQIDKFIFSNGEVHSGVSGVILQTSIKKGVISTGIERIVIAVKGYELAIKENKEDVKQFEVGDEVMISLPNIEDKITSNIEKIGLADKEGMVSITALLPKGDYTVGSSLEYEIKKKSSDYQKCIPLGAIRENTDGTYVLVIRDKSGVLGKEEVAFKINVTVESQDSSKAAISGSISRDDSIIVSSNKNITEGDRVRIDEEK